MKLQDTCPSEFLRGCEFSRARTGIARPQGNPRFNCWRNCQVGGAAVWAIFLEGLVLHGERKAKSKKVKRSPFPASHSPASGIGQACLCLITLPVPPLGPSLHPLLRPEEIGAERGIPESSISTPFILAIVYRLGPLIVLWPFFGEKMFS